MSAPLRAALALLLLAGGPSLAAPPPEVAVRFALVPSMAPEPGEALAFRVVVEGPAGLAVQGKAWLEGDVRGAQTWAGGWGPSARYRAAWVLDPEGRAEAWLAVRAAELGSAPLVLHARVRDEQERVLGEGAVPLAPSRGAKVEGLAPGAWAVGAWEGAHLVALAPVAPFAPAGALEDLPGRFVLRAPPGAVLQAVGPDGTLLGPWAPRAPGALRLEALLVDAPGDEGAEFVRLRNLGEEAEGLAGWELRGEGWRAALEGTLDPGAEASLAGDAAAYRALTGRGDHPEGPRLEGRVGLANAGGRVELRWLGELADAVAWGRAAEGPGWEGAPLALLGPGRMHRRGGLDTDRAADFSREPWMAGWGGRAPFAAPVVARPFGRDDALAVALGALAEAREEVLVEVYAFTHPGLAAALHEALARGVRVRVLVEAAPVGGASPEQQALLDGLAHAGAEVLRIGGSGRDRYGVLHAKFAVLDRGAVLLGSENWTPSGFPEGPGGNLGWGAWLRGPELAGALAEVWAEDADPARADVAAWSPRGPGARPLRAPAPPVEGPAEPLDATLLLAPDHARGEVLVLLAGARERIDVEALQLPLAWSHGPNPVVEALRDAGRRGVRVRALLDGTPGSENAATAAALQAWADAMGAPLEVRLAQRDRVHNKGVLLDGRAALLGSLNFGEASMTWNRESALLLEGRGVRAYGALFEADWAASSDAEPARADPAWLAAPLAVLAGAAAWRGRRRP